MSKLPSIHSDASRVQSPRCEKYDKQHGSSLPSTTLPALSKSCSAPSVRESPLVTLFHEPSSQISSSSKMLLPVLLTPLVISPYQSSIRSPAMSPSSVPLRNLKCLDANFPASRPHSPGEVQEVSSLNLRKKALTPMGLLRSSARASPACSPSKGDHFIGDKIHHVSSLILASRISPKHASLPADHQNTSVRVGSAPQGISFGLSFSSWSSSQSDDSALTDAELEATVKHAIAVSLQEDLPLEKDEWVMDPESQYKLSASANPIPTLLPSLSNIH